MARSELTHVERAHPPWRDTPGVTECGRVVGTVPAVTRASLVEWASKVGAEKMRAQTCEVCWARCQHRPAWEDYPAASLERETNRAGSWRYGRKLTALDFELRALAELVAAHRDEFASRLAVHQQLGRLDLAAATAEVLTAGQADAGGEPVTVTKAARKVFAEFRAWLADPGAAMCPHNPLGHPNATWNLTDRLLQCLDCAAGAAEDRSLEAGGTTACDLCHSVVAGRELFVLGAITIRGHAKAGATAAVSIPFGTCEACNQ